MFYLTTHSTHFIYGYMASVVVIYFMTNARLEQLILVWFSVPVFNLQ